MASELVPPSVPRSWRRVQWAWNPSHWWRVPLVVQWLALIVLNVYQYRRFALTHDFALYWQALWLMAHGHLYPYSTVAGYPFLDNHLELIMFLLVPFVWIVPSALVLLLIQSTALIGAEWIAWTWIATWSNGQHEAWRPWLRATGIVFLVANPWTYWAAAFDFHPEALMAFTIMGAAYALWRRDNLRLLIWAGITLLAGDVACLLVVGLGLTAVLIRRWRAAVALFIVGLGWLLVIGAIGADQGAVLAPSYGYLARGVAHLTVPSLVIHMLLRPGPAVHMLWQRKANLFANLSPSGLIGAVSPWGIGATITALVPSSLTAYIVFSEPGFQNIPVVGLVAVGSIMGLAWIGRRITWRYLVPGLATLLTLNTLGWGVVWLPLVVPTWVRVSAGPSRTMATIQRLLPKDAALIAPQAIIGRFANRMDIVPMMGNTRFRMVAGRPNYILLALYQGVHISSVSLMARELGDLAQNPRARLVYYHDGVYLWRITGKAPLTFSPRRNLPAWAFGSQSGAPVVVGTARSWYVAGGSNAGNILDEAYWRESPGLLMATVQYSSQGPLWLQLWDATTGRLVTQRYVPSTQGVKTTANILLVFPRADVGHSHVYAGFGPWRIRPVSGHQPNQLEIRVSAQPSSMVNIYTVSLSRRL